jgi:hypothetical protein
MLQLKEKLQSIVRCSDLHPKLRIYKYKVKVLNEIREIHLTLKRFGILKASHDCFIRIINCLLYFKIFRCNRITMETLDPQFLKLDSRYRVEFFGIDDLVDLKDQKKDWIPMPEITDSFKKGDCCLQIFHNNSLASYSWMSNHPTMVTPQLEVIFDTGHVYRYKTFTYPHYRGKRLPAFGCAQCLKKYVAEGYKGFLSIVASNNFSSLRMAYRTGWKNIGTVYVFRLAGKYFIFSRGKLKEYNLKIKPKNSI